MLPYPSCFLPFFPRGYAPGIPKRTEIGFAYPFEGDIPDCTLGRNRFFTEESSLFRFFSEVPVTRIWDGRWEPGMDSCTLASGVGTPATQELMTIFKANDIVMKRV